jgi:hypothetical protein
LADKSQYFGFIAIYSQELNSQSQAKQRLASLSQHGINIAAKFAQYTQPDLRNEFFK